MNKTLFLFLFSSFLPLTSFAKSSQELEIKGSTNQVMNILTMNIHCFKDDWKFRLSHILDKLNKISPDVIAFQEVCVDPVTHESEILYIQNFLTQNGYPINAIEAQFTHYAWDQFDEYIVLITKKNVSAIDRGFLPESLLQRGYIGFNIAKRWYINTHLEFRADNSQFRKNQINFLTNHFLNQSHLIMGDFNSSPDDEEQSIFKQKNYKSYFPGATQTGDDGNSHNNIDGFWFSPNFSSSLSSYSGSILFKEKVQDRYLSDHFAVLAQLDFFEGN